MSLRKYDHRKEEDSRCQSGTKNLLITKNWKKFSDPGSANYHILSLGGGEGYGDLLSNKQMEDSNTVVMLYTLCLFPRTAEQKNWTI